MNHSNDERTVRCPVEGCDATPLARGINLHLRRSTGEGHGPQGDVPEHISTDTLETVGEREVKMDYPEERESETVTRLCPYCSKPFEGENGVLIHLGQLAGTKNHPEDAGEFHSEADFPEVEVDGQGNVRRVIGDEKIPEHTETAKAGAVPNQRVYRFIADLLAEGEARIAHRLRKQLLGIDNANRPLRNGPSHTLVFEAILGYVYSEGAQQEILAALEPHGIMISVDEESAIYTADEALDLAGYLDNRGPEEWPDPDQIRDFIEFLRYSAEIIQNEEAQTGLHEEFQKWR